MRGKYKFREPLGIDQSGGYITAGQLQFFLNRPRGKAHFQSQHVEFKKYYFSCCMYNIVYDMLEDDSDCAKMYWDTKKECVSVSFAVNGKVAKALSLIQTSFFEDIEDPDEDSFGLSY